MKTFFLLIMILPFFTSCGTDEDTSNSGASTSLFSATVNGKAWAAGKLENQYTAEAFITNLGAVEIYGYDGNTFTTITLGILDKKDLVSGKTLDFVKYDLNSLDYGNSADYIIADANGNTLKAFHASSGMIKITTVSDNKIKGTFSFEAENEDNSSDKISIKNGEFDLPLR